MIIKFTKILLDLMQYNHITSDGSQAFMHARFTKFTPYLINNDFHRNDNIHQTQIYHS
jgi:hypothetical protein